VHGFGLMMLSVGGDTGTTLVADFGEGTNVIADPSAWNTVTLVEAGGGCSQGYYKHDLNQDCAVDFVDFAKLASDGWLAEPQLWP